MRLRDAVKCTGAVDAAVPSAVTTLRIGVFANGRAGGGTARYLSKEVSRIKKISCNSDFHFWDLKFIDILL